MLVKERHSLDKKYITDLISISHEYPKKLTVFVGDQNKQGINLLESNIEHKIVI